MILRVLPVAFLVTTTACFDPEPATTTNDDTGSTGPDATTTMMVVDESSTTVGPVDDTDDTTDTADTTDTTDTGGCADDCDDAVPCTEDACVDGACVNTPVDTLCDDGVDCTADSCDAAMGCTNASDDALCDDGVPCTADTCGAKGCASAPDDTMCDDGVGCTTDACDPTAGCTSTPDDTVCDGGSGCGSGVCDPLLDCQTAGSSVLVFNGSGGSTAPEDAVASLGYSPIVVIDETSFVTAFDAGGFEAIVFDVPSVFSPVPVAVQTRLDTWVGAGERLIFGFWDLDADAAMAATLGVTVSASFDTPLPIHPDPASPVDLFGMPETIIPPITYPDNWSDNGDELALAGPGFIAARFNDPVAGSGAIVVTHDDHVVTNGFIISEIGQGPVDSDADGVNDGVELLRNELTLVCSAP